MIKKKYFDPSVLWSQLAVSFYNISSFFAKVILIEYEILKDRNNTYMTYN